MADSPQCVHWTNGALCGANIVPGTDKSINPKEEEKNA